MSQEGFNLEEIADTRLLSTCYRFIRLDSVSQFARICSVQSYCLIIPLGPRVMPVKFGKLAASGKTVQGDLNHDQLFKDDPV